MFIPNPLKAEPGKRTVALICMLVTVYLAMGLLLLLFWWAMAVQVPNKNPESVIATVAGLVGGAGTLAVGLYTTKSILRKKGNPDDPQNKGGD